jgi:hypothetical protein
MTDWRALAEMLAPVARLSGCRCEFERQDGVPIWRKTETGLERKLLRECSRCAAMRAFDAAAGSQTEVTI